jgi:hypothetical protein
MPPYQENPDHTPNPLDYDGGSVDTTGIGMGGFGLEHEPYPPHVTGHVATDDGSLPDPLGVLPILKQGQDAGESEPTPAVGESQKDANEADGDDQQAVAGDDEADGLDDLHGEELKAIASDEDVPGRSGLTVDELREAIRKHRLGLDGLTGEELKERAREANIKGRSSMNTDELRSALRQHEADQSGEDGGPGAPAEGSAQPGDNLDEGSGTVDTTGTA